MHSIADVFLRENGTEQRRGKRGIGRGRNGGRSDEVPTPSKRRRRRKSIRPEASYLKVCIGQKRKREEVRASERGRASARARSGRRRVAKLSVKSSREKEVPKIQ